MLGCEAVSKTSDSRESVLSREDEVYVQFWVFAQQEWVVALCRSHLSYIGVTVGNELRHFFSMGSPELY
ncbi:hypothetical protein Actkin_02149 [Actinokineospora sp. UTMC 2448]|nr:hypothetical protein Actkin_02149 [Actinokineospora sp. UTMC 2448]